MGTVEEIVPVQHDSQDTRQPASDRCSQRRDHHGVITNNSSQLHAGSIRDWLCLRRRPARSQIVPERRSTKTSFDDPEPQVAVSELGESSVNFIVRPWVKTSDYADVKYAPTERIKLGFDRAAGFNFPFPSRDVYTHAAG
ncbi:MAG: hypothetical protein R3C02_01700 [Planctomycetaceae bacterium]